MGETPKKIARAAAIRALEGLFERAFGSEKGSGDAYSEWCEEVGLCETWDGEEEFRDEHNPPCQYELMLALGLTPQEIVNALHINPKTFSPELCDGYAVAIPSRKGA